MATATFIITDTTTQGSWIGVYGADGYAFPLTLADSYPGYVTGWGESGPGTFQWGTGSEVRRLQDPGNPSGTRYGITWYHATAFSLTFGVGSTTRRLAVYCLDDDASSRNQTVALYDGATLLDIQTVSSFSGGKWLVWDVTGNLTLTATNLAGFANAVVAAVMWHTPVGGGNRRRRVLITSGGG